MKNSSVTSTRINYYIQTTYYKPENASLLNGERELTSSILNIKSHSSSVNITSSGEYREFGKNTSNLLLVMVTFALLFGLVTCFYTIFTKVRHCEKRQKYRQSTHLAKIRTDNHVVGISMATAKSAEGQHSLTVPVNEGAAGSYPTRTRIHTQPLPARPPLESRHAHARSEPLSDSR